MMSVLQKKSAKFKLTHYPASRLRGGCPSKARNCLRRKALARKPDFDTGRLSIKNDTTPLCPPLSFCPIDNRTVAFTVTQSLGARPPPGNNPSYRATAELLAPAGQTFP